MQKYIFYDSSNPKNLATIKFADSSQVIGMPHIDDIKAEIDIQKTVCGRDKHFEVAPGETRGVRELIKLHQRR